MIPENIEAKNPKTIYSNYYIGLMGVANDGTLVTPSGKRLFKVPSWCSWRIQRIQHWFVSVTAKPLWYFHKFVNK